MSPENKLENCCLVAFFKRTDKELSPDDSKKLNEIELSILGTLEKAGLMPRSDMITFFGAYIEETQKHLENLMEIGYVKTDFIEKNSKKYNEYLGIRENSRGIWHYLRKIENL